MAYVAPVHKPTSIRHALRIRFLSPDHEDLVLAKANRLEIWRVSGDGMVLLHTKLIYGTISMMQRLQPRDLNTDLLFIGTDRLQYFNLFWDHDTNQLETVEQAIEDVAEPFMRHAQSQNKCLVDPSGKFMAMHLWEGVFNVFRLPTRKGNTNKLVALETVRLTELWIKSSTFLHSRTGHPMVALLYREHEDRDEARIAVYRLTKNDRGDDVSTFDPKKDRELDEVIQDPFASILIPVPVAEEKRYHVRNNDKARAHLGGVLVVGETLLTYFDTLTYLGVSSALKEPKIYVAWADYDGVQYFLADDYGRMDILTIRTTVEPTGVVVTGMDVSPLSFADGTKCTSRAYSLVYLGDNILFLASHHGDSQLLRVDIFSGTMVLLKTLSNNSPIMDFAIMDMGNREGDIQLGSAFSSGQARIVAGCGAYGDGSLRSIRSGVGLEDEGILDDFQGTRGLFTLRSFGAPKHDTIVLSFIAETRVLRFDAEGGIEEVYEFQGLAFNQETLLAANMPTGQVLQITPNSVRLLDPESGIALSTWDAPNGGSITAASANSTWALVAVDGTSLVSLNLLSNLAAVTSDAASCPNTGQPDQISCLYVTREPLNLGVVGWWSGGSISIVDPKSLKPIHGETLRQTEDSASVPRGLALVQLHPPDVSGPTLLVAMEDGNVVTFNVRVDGFALSGRKSVTLGSSPARLHVLPQDDGICNVFATTEHSSLIYSAEGRIVYSATTADDATYVARFDSEAFPDSMVLSTDEHVRLCHVDKERLTHVKTLPMHETVRRVAYSPGLKAFGLGCIKKELVGNEETITSTFKLVDEIIFQPLGKPFVLNASATLEMVECVIRAELPDSGGTPAERFIVGTSSISDETTVESETQGRILVLGVSEDRQVYQIVSQKLKGACRCLGVMGHDIVAGLSKTVVVYSYTEDTKASGTLRKLAAYRPATFPVDLDISGNLIGIVDLMQSLSIVEYTAPLDGAKAKLEERARHYQPAWATSVCHLDDDRWLEADAQGNLMVLRRNLEGATDQDRSRLEVTSEMNLGEQINRIRRLYLSPAENAVVYPRAFFGSVEGTLYLYGDISPKYQDLLLTFQSRLKEYIHAPGNTDFDAWRAYRNQAREGEAPYRCVDGEMIERFLDLDEGKQELVCEGLGPGVEDMRNLVEELRRMH